MQNYRNTEIQKNGKMKTEKQLYQNTQKAMKISFFLMSFNTQNLHCLLSLV